MSLGNETFCYQWYEEYQKLSYCPTETPKSTHPGKKNIIKSNKVKVLHVVSKSKWNMSVGFFSQKITFLKSKKN